MSGVRPGALVTGMIVGEAKRGVLIELGARELVLPRSRYGAGADRIEAAGYGEPLTVEVVAAPDQPGGIALTRVGIERAVRQPRRIEGALQREGTGFRLAPVDGSPAFAVLVLDHLDPSSLVGITRPWEVGAPYRDLRLIAPASDADLA